MSTGSLYRVTGPDGDEWFVSWEAARECRFRGLDPLQMWTVEIPRSALGLIELLMSERERIEREIEARATQEPKAAPPQLLVYRVTSASGAEKWFATLTDADAHMRDVLARGEAVTLHPVPVPATAEEFIAFAGPQKKAPEQPTYRSVEDDLVVSALRYCGWRDLPRSQLEAALKVLDVTSAEAAALLDYSGMRP